MKEHLREYYHKCKMFQVSICYFLGVLVLNLCHYCSQLWSMVDLGGQKDAYLCKLWIVRNLSERDTGIEPVYTAWEARSSYFPFYATPSKLVTSKPSTCASFSLVLDLCILCAHVERRSPTVSIVLVKKSGLK